MKLRYSSTSPYVRKVTIAAIELGLADRIERVPTDVQDPASELSSDNPLGKVPTLTLDVGGSLYDSPVICEYLDSLHGGPKLFPASGPERWQALCQQALGDGILDAALLRMIEANRRPENLRWQGWLDLQSGKIERALDQFENEAESLDGPLTIGQITAGCALGYLDFRFAVDEWRAKRPQLTAWFERFAARPSMRETMPG